jgi:hypothetical protein
VPRLPEPFFDADGFPRCLRRVRDWVSSRGGTVTVVDGTDGYAWVLSAPSPGPLVVRVGFDDHDGDADVRAGMGMHLIVNPPEAYELPPGGDVTALESAVAALLAGGLLEYRAMDGDGRSATGWILLGDFGIEERGTGPVPIWELRRSRAELRYEWTTYPAWPSS